MEKSKTPFVVFMSGGETFELDFQLYSFPDDTAIFIPEGHYYQCANKQEVIPASNRNLHEYRYLFSKIISIGHINTERKLQQHNDTFLNEAKNQWLQMNPFNASNEELEILFDLNDWLETNVQANLPLETSFLSRKELQQIVRRKLDLTFFQWKNHKLIEQAHQKLWETGGHIKETAFELGFKDPSYFTRFFKSKTHRTPAAFLASLEEKPFQDQLLKDFTALVNQEFRQHHDVSYYADCLNMTTRTLSRNIKAKTESTAKQFIINRILKEARSRIRDIPVTSLAFELGFEEVSHFTTFIKTHAAVTPTQLAKSTSQ